MCDREMEVAVLVVLVFTIVLSEVKCNYPPTTEVEYDQGIIVGTRLESNNDRRPFYAFKGIPFALPPVGDLRLKDPIGNVKWNDTRDGSWNPPVCAQYKNNIYAGEEDCLYLNVYTPKPGSASYPVMVFIHGGDFISGGASEYHPLPLLNHDIVLVVLQYRLGILGFLSAEDSDLPGNLGLKDQSMALFWVHNYIEAFGGDPDRVTIFGSGSGAASVHYQILSPYSKGLFSRAIMQSGSSLCPRMLRNHHAYVSTVLISKFNCRTPDTPVPSYPFAPALIECLKNVPVEELAGAYRDYFEWQMFPIVTVPRVDGDFLPDHPTILLKEGRYNKVDIIAGYNLHDGAIVTATMYHDLYLLKLFKDKFLDVGALLMSFDEEENPAQLAGFTYQRLMRNKNIKDPDGAETFTKLFTNRLFSVGIHDMLSLHAKTSPGNKIYRYKLSHRGEFSFCNFVDKAYIGDGWVCHGDDIPYLFNDRSGSTLLHQDSLYVQDIIVTMWTNFAAHGVATPDESLGFLWNPSSVENHWHLNLNISPKMTLNMDRKTLQFWHSLNTVLNKHLYPNEIGVLILDDDDDEEIEEISQPVFQTALDDKLKSEQAYQRSIVVPNKILNKAIDPTNQFERQVVGVEGLTGIVVEDLIAASGMWSRKIFPNINKYKESTKYKNTLHGKDISEISDTSDTSMDETADENSIDHTVCEEQKDCTVDKDPKDHTFGKFPNHAFQKEPEDHIFHKKPLDNEYMNKLEKYTREKDQECYTCNKELSNCNIDRNSVYDITEKLENKSKYKETPSWEEAKDNYFDSLEEPMQDVESGSSDFENFSGKYSNSNIIDIRDIADTENSNLYNMIQAGLLKAQVILKGVTEGESTDDIATIVDKDNLVEIVDTYGEYVLLYLKDVRVTPEQMQELQQEQNLVCLEQDSQSAEEEKPLEKRLLEKPIVLQDELYPNKKKIIYGKINFHSNRKFEVPVLVSSEGDGGAKS